MQDQVAVASAHIKAELPRIYVPGDVLIGGLAPVHYPPSGSSNFTRATVSADKQKCDGPFNIRGIEMAEAIMFAVDKVNKDDSLLPDIKLGVDIRDSCNSVDFAIRETLHFNFVREAYSVVDVDDLNKCPNMTLEIEPTVKTVAIVGAAFSGISMAVASLAGLFNVPVVSYASTSRLLSDRSRFQNFLRTVPSDTLQAKAMVDVIKKYQWNFVAVVASDTEYGRSGIQAFKETAASLEKDFVCVSVDELFTARTPKNEVVDIVRKINSFSKVRVIVLFAELNDADYFIKTAREENLTGYIWLGSDAWSESYHILRQNTKILRNFVGFKPGIEPYAPFRDFFKKVTKERKARNFWLRQHLAYVQEEISKSHPEFSPYTSTAIDAVYAVAHGLHKVYNCSDTKCFSNVSAASQTEVYKSICNVSFLSPTQHRVIFNANGSSVNFYNLTITVKDRTRLKFVSFGSWHPESGIKITQKQVDERLAELRYIARCSQTCSPGFRKEPHARFPECCWDCLRCRGDTFSNQSGATICSTCPLGFKASRNKSQCVAIPPTVLKWSSGLGVVIVCTCALGVVAVFVTFAVLAVHRVTPVVKGSSWEICCTLLLGLICCYVAPMLFMIQTDPFSCQIRPFISTTGVCLIIGSILTKTNRIARIFGLNLMRTGKAHFLSTQWQIIFVLVCVLAGNTVMALSITLEPPELRTVAYKTGQVAMECSTKSMTGFAIWISYSGGLALLTTYQAFLIRKVPENYNEAKFIAFTMVTLCLGGSVFIPTYLSTYGVYRNILSCFLLIFCSTAVLACIFGPKLYIIFFRPKKNQPQQPQETEVTKP